MAATPATAVLTLVAFAVLIASAWSWLLAAGKAGLTWHWLPQGWTAPLEAALKSVGLSPRLPLLAWSPRRHVPWAVFDLIAVLFVWLLSSVIVSGVLHQLGGIEENSSFDKLSFTHPRLVVIGDCVARLLMGSICLVLIALRTGATPWDFGWSWKKLTMDLRLGLIGFVMVGPPVYALQGVLVHFWPSKHPLIEMFKTTPDSGLFIWLLVSAAVVAPLFEEFIFRVVLQGFLEKMFSFRGDLHELLFGAARHSAVDLSPGEAAAYFPVETPATALQPELRGPLAWLPIAISSAIFALLHYSHGPDWIPLLVLSAGMGYLYQRTHRLLPSLVVHVLLNSLSLWGLWVQVYEGSS